MSENRVRIVLDPVPASAGLVRGIIAEHGAGLPDRMLADAELLATELVANAIRHGEPDIVFELSVDGSALSVAVTDHGAPFEPRPPHSVDVAATSGRGLLIVGAIATAWGTHNVDHVGGKTVWFELGDDA